LHNCTNEESYFYLKSEGQELLGKGAIELVPPGQEGQGFYSTFFIVPKKDGG
jgi:hypothetical protein